MHNIQKSASRVCFYLFRRYRCCVSLNPSFSFFLFFLFLCPAIARPSAPPPPPTSGLLELNDPALVSVLRWASIEVEKTLWKEKTISYLNVENLYLVCCLILLQVAFDEMQNKVKELNNVIAQNPPDMKKLQLVLQGSVSVQV